MPCSPLLADGVVNCRRPAARLDCVGRKKVWERISHFLPRELAYHDNGGVGADRPILWRIWQLLQDFSRFLNDIWKPSSGSTPSESAALESKEGA